MFYAKEKWNTQGLPYMPLSTPFNPTASLIQAANRPKLFVPKPIRPMPTAGAVNERLSKLGFSSASVLSKLWQLSQAQEDSMTNSNIDTANSFEFGRCQRRVSEVSFQSHGEESAFKPMTEELPMNKKPSAPLSTKIGSLDITSNVEDQKSVAKEPLKRWNRTDDKHLWKIIRSIASDQNEPLEEVLECIISNDQSPYWKLILPTLRNQGKIYRIRIPISFRIVPPDFVGPVLTPV